MTRKEANKIMLLGYFTKKAQVGDNASGRDPRVKKASGEYAIEAVRNVAQHLRMHKCAHDRAVTQLMVEAGDQEGIRQRILQTRIA